MPLYVVEHKTAGEDISGGSHYWRRLTLDPQVSLYLEGARSLGHDVAAVLYDVLRKPMHRPLEKNKTNKEAETPDAYGRRVLEAIAEKPAYYYQRGTIVRLERDKYEAHVDRWQTGKGIVEARRLKMFPRNPDACKLYQRECDYMPLCCNTASADDPLMFSRAERKYSELDKDGRDGFEFLTQSSMRVFRACPKKYYYKYELLLRRVSDDVEVLRMGRSVHKALEVWWRSGGDLDASLAALDPAKNEAGAFVRAKESAMVMGYHAMWGKPPRVISVERSFEMPLLNPDSSGVSKTFVLAGRVDAIAEVGS